MSLFLKMASTDQPHDDGEKGYEIRIQHTLIWQKIADILPGLSWLTLNALPHLIRPDKNTRGWVKSTDHVSSSPRSDEICHPQGVRRQFILYIAHIYHLVYSHHDTFSSVSPLFTWLLSCPVDFLFQALHTPRADFLKPHHLFSSSIYYLT